MPGQTHSPGIPGEDFIRALHYLIRTVRIHQDNNQLIRDCVTQFKGLLDDMTSREDVTLQLWRSRFHLQGEKILFRRETVHVINEMASYFTERNLGGLFFPSLVSRAPAEDIITFIRLLSDSVRHSDPREWLDSRVKKQGFTWVEVLRKQKEDESSSGKRCGSTRRDRGRKAYFEALETVRDVAEKASQGIVGVRRARRLAQTIVDLVQEDRSLMLGLASIRNYDDYTYTHSVNVSLIATSLGRHIGLSQVSLEHLTVCGLFHDLGKVAMPREMLHKQGQLSAEEWDQMRRHPLMGIRHILRLHAPPELRSRIILGPFEHHLNPDMTGYPKTHFMKKLSLLGRILRIADVYEALTAERAYRPRAFTPAEALRKMWSEGEKSFDILLLKSFIHMMGVYPIGSMVLLSDGRMGMVTGYPDDSRRTQPLVRIIVDDGTGRLSRGDEVSLSVQGASDASRLHIVRDFHPARLGIQVSDLFLMAEPEEPAA